jgi:hypothetical protein
MTRMFGGLAMIDVMSICTLTLLIISLDSRPVEKARKDSGALKSAFITFNAFAKPMQSGNSKKAAKPITLGIEVRISGQVLGAADKGVAVIGIEESPGQSVLYLNKSAAFLAGDEIHVFVRDRGSGAISDYQVYFEQIHFPGLNADARCEPVSATELSWHIPLTPSLDPKQLLVLREIR